MFVLIRSTIIGMYTFLLSRQYGSIFFFCDSALVIHNASESVVTCVPLYRHKQSWGNFYVGYTLVYKACSNTFIDTLHSWRRVNVSDPGSTSPPNGNTTLQQYQWQIYNGKRYCSQGFSLLNLTQEKSAVCLPRPPDTRRHTTSTIIWTLLSLFLCARRNMTDPLRPAVRR